MTAHLFGFNKKFKSFCVFLVFFGVNIQFFQRIIFAIENYPSSLIRKLLIKKWAHKMNKLVCRWIRLYRSVIKTECFSLVFVVAFISICQSCFLFSSNRLGWCTKESTEEEKYIQHINETMFTERKLARNCVCIIIPILRFRHSIQVSKRLYAEHPTVEIFH